MNKKQSIIINVPEEYVLSNSNDLCQYMFNP